MPDQVHHRFEGQHFADGGQGVVLTDAVAGRHRVRREDSRLAKCHGLRVGEHRHGHLSESGAVEHTLSVADDGAVKQDRLWIVLNNLKNGEPEVGSGVRVSPVPDRPRGAGAGVQVHPHARALDALAWEHVGRERWGDDGGGAGHRCTVD